MAPLPEKSRQICRNHIFALFLCLTLFCLWFVPGLQGVVRANHSVVPEGGSLLDQAHSVKDNNDLVLVKVPSKGSGGAVKATLFALIGGIGLFMFGIHLMSEGLQKAAGNRIKSVLGKLTGKPIYGLVLGTVITAIIQSSSATTVMVVGFVNAGLLEFTQSIGVILGANIGTTVTTQVVALKLDQFALPAIGLGMIMYLFFDARKVKQAGQAVMGFGLLFLGIVIMKNAIPPEAKETIRHLFLMSSGTLKGTLFGLLVGTVATAIVQSSSITVSLIVILAFQGLVTDLKEVIPLILGCNIGTCTTALLASLKTDREAQRAAAAHTFFNIFGALMTLTIFYHLYLWVIPKIGGNMPHQIANLHVMIKLVDAVIFVPIVRPFSRFLTWFVPEKRILARELARPHYLIEGIKQDPTAALELAIKETVRFGGICRAVIKTAMDGFTYNDEELLKRGHIYAQAARTLRNTIMDFVIDLSARDISEDEAKKVANIIVSLYNFDKVLTQARKLLKLGQTKAACNIPLMGSALEELKKIYHEVDDALTEVSGRLPEFHR
ncbi:MAG: hypothetical protein DRG63_04480 [Deltaproteobacteria bacterium]|nr:MAG: hypothetical protein DRG63_04480 [Deltaproteobacteria bacterium]